MYPLIQINNTLDIRIKKYIYFFFWIFKKLQIIYQLIIQSVLYKLKNDQESYPFKVECMVM